MNNVTSLIKHAICIFAMLCCILCLPLMLKSAYAAEEVDSGTCGDNLTWVLDDKGTLTISGTGEMYDYSPDDVAPWYSCRSQINTIVIDEGITSVGHYAFYNLYKAITVSFPSTLTLVGEQAFASCNKIEEVSFSETGITLWGNAFKDCINIKKIVIPNISGVLSESPFSGCVSVTELIIGGSSVPALFDSISHIPLSKIVFLDSVKTIERGAFSSMTELKDVTWPEHLEKISDLAFYRAGLTDLTLPSCVSIGRDAFMYSSLTTINLPNNLTEIQTYAFSDVKIKEIVFPDSVTTLSPGVFYGCKNLESVVFGKGIKEWKTKDDLTSYKVVGIFENCSNLRNVDLCEVEIIGSGAFFGCSSLKEIHFPKTVKGVASGDVFYSSEIKGAFTNSSLTTVYIDDLKSWLNNYSMPYMPDGIDVIVNDELLEVLELPDSLTEIYDGQFCGINSIKKVIIPESITRIGNGGTGRSFRDCRGLESVIIPESVSSIGIYSFERCTNLKSVVFEGNSVKLDEGAFSDCTSLTDVILPNNIVNSTSSGFWFYGCTSLANIDLPKALAGFDLSAFAGCKSLEEIYIPPNITTITDTWHVGNNLTYEPFNSILIVDEGSSAHSIVVEKAYKYDLVTGHQVTDWQVGLEPTCIEKGTSSGTCNSCGREVTKELPAKGHSFAEEFTIDTPASCTADGSKSRHCIRCTEVTDVTVIPATGHTFGEWVEVTPSTCEDSGLEQRSCETCGVIESRNMEPNGHDFDDEYTVDVEATCTTDGSQSKHCKNCDAVIDSEVIPAFGHSYGEWITTQEPTCVDAGSKNQVCSTCGDKNVQEIPATGVHTYGDWITIKEPTLDEEGSKEHTCSVCGHAESEVIPKIPAQPIADEAIADAEEAGTAAENAAKDAEEAQKAADEAAKTPGDAAIAAAENAKTVADIAKEAAEAYKEAADKADKAADKAIEQAETDEAKAKANASKETSSALVTAAEATVENANKAVETASASITAAENAKTQAEQAAAKKAQEEAAAKQKADAERALIAANNGILDPSLPKVKISKPKAAKKSMEVKWKKLTKKQLKKVKGIEIEYSLTPDFQNPVFKSVGKKKANVKIKKLLSKKTYYVRAHTYVIRGGVKYVSNWTTKKKVKIK